LGDPGGEFVQRRIPPQRHAGVDEKLLQARNPVYELARQQNPSRWTAQTRSWRFDDAVHLHPDSAEAKKPPVVQSAARIDDFMRQLG
jgi:hypothetical protein